ncbi:MAG TPA: type II secretion system protein [Candidatus Paceibacterota bacterium]|nr:type II secretion system protein [Candidatus Paceibacterota bacterium]
MDRNEHVPSPSGRFLKGAGAASSARSGAGFSLVELVLSLAIAGLIVTVLVGGLLYSADAAASLWARTQARWSASECLHAARWLRDSQGITSLSVGTHGLVVAGGQWTLSGASDSADIHTRQMTVSDISSDEKEVQCVVSWESRFGTRSVSAVTRFTNWQ